MLANLHFGIQNRTAETAALEWAIWEGNNVQKKRSVRNGEASLDRRDWYEGRAGGAVSLWNIDQQATRTQNLKNCGLLRPGKFDNGETAKGCDGFTAGIAAACDEKRRKFRKWNKSTYILRQNSGR